MVSWLISPAKAMRSDESDPGWLTQATMRPDDMKRRERFNKLTRVELAEGQMSSEAPV